MRKAAKEKDKEQKKSKIRNVNMQGRKGEGCLEGKTN